MLFNIELLNSFFRIWGTDDTLKVIEYRKMVMFEGSKCMYRSVTITLTCSQCARYVPALTITCVYRVSAILVLYVIRR